MVSTFCILLLLFCLPCNSFSLNKIQCLFLRVKLFKSGPFKACRLLLTLWPWKTISPATLTKPCNITQNSKRYMTITRSAVLNLCGPRSGSHLPGGPRAKGYFVIFKDINTQTAVVVYSFYWWTLKHTNFVNFPLPQFSAVVRDRETKFVSGPWGSKGRELEGLNSL